MIVLVKTFSFNPDPSFSDESLLHHSSLVLVRSFPYAPSGSFKVEFLLHTSC